jgi:hypothetical protein
MAARKGLAQEEITMKVDVTVTDKHVQKGVCADTNRCAVALALRDAGIGNNKDLTISVGGSLDIEYSGKSYENTMSVLIPLPAKANNFISSFDAIEEQENEDAARAKLAAKLAKKPFKFTVNIPDFFAPVVYTKPTRTASKRKK